MSNYWSDRVAKAQATLSEKNTRQVETQIRKYYKKAFEQTIKDFEDTYMKLLNAMEDGKEPTPADLYKLDKYWKLQAQLSSRMEKLGNKIIPKLSAAFELNFFEVYHSLALDGGDTYTTLDAEAVQQMINSIWCADGKSWSARIWENTKKLTETLNDGLIHCVASGKTTKELKNILQERFNVSYGAADALVRTEMAHIQTQAAQKRYQDYGIEYVQVWADADERRCPICAKLHKKKIPVSAQMPIPAHPRCRCCVIPVVD